MRLINMIAQNGLRVFSYDDVLSLPDGSNISQSYAKRMLYDMAKRGELQALGNGLYALPVEFLSGGPIHSFEIGMKLVKIGAISHRSAMFFHEMTDQIFNRVYITSPRIAGSNLSTKNNYFIDGSYFQVKRIDPKHFFGVKRFFIAESAIWITDVEKTLLDGLSDPDLCGGFREVMHAFSQSFDKIEPHKFISYAHQMPTVIAKRAGWMLEELGCVSDLRVMLEAIPIKTLQKLNPKGPRTGSINKRWMMIENV